MAKPTLLEIVQDLLSATNSDTANSIFDTVESEQIARIVGDCYEVLRVRLEIPEVYSLFELESSGNSSQPTRMKRPSVAQTIDRLQYDCRINSSDPSLFNDIKFVDLETFLDYSNQMDLTQSNVGSYTVNISNATVEVRYRKDQAPSYFTSWNTEDVLLDSIDLNLETTLQKTKSLAYGKLSNSFQLANSWVPPFVEAGIVLLKQESKTQAFAELKQTDNAGSAKKARVLMPKVIKDQWSDPYSKPYRYGRGSKK